MRQRWVFGIVNADQPNKPILRYVPRRDAATLMPIICRHIPQSSTVVLDMWGAYNGVTANGYNHLTVNHSANFVDPATGQCYWNDRYPLSLLASYIRFFVIVDSCALQVPTQTALKVHGGMRKDSCCIKTAALHSSSMNGSPSTCGTNGELVNGHRWFFCSVPH